MYLTSGQVLLFCALLWAVLLLWPKMGAAFGSLLTRHSWALQRLYAHLGRGLAAYSERIQRRINYPEVSFEYDLEGENRVDAALKEVTRRGL